MRDGPETTPIEATKPPGDADRRTARAALPVAAGDATRTRAGWAWGLSPYAWLVTAIWVAALAVRLWPVGGASLDYDEGVYWASLRAMAQGHPLFTAVFSSQPPLFLAGLFPVYLLFGQTLVAARLAVVLYSLVGLGAIYVAGRTLGGRWVGALALALLAFDPLYVMESHTLQAEVPALAFALVSAALAILAMQRTPPVRRWLAAAAGIALALGIGVKLFDVVAAVPVALYLLTPAGATLLDHAGRLRGPERGPLARALRVAAPDLGFAALGALAGFALVFAPFAGRWPELYDQVVRFHLAASQTSHQGLAANLQILANSGSEWILALLALGLGGWALSRRWWPVVPPLLWALAALAFLLGQHPLLAHHLTLLVPPLVLTAAVAAPALAAPRGAVWGRRDAPIPVVGSPALLSAGLVGIVLVWSLGASIVQAREAAISPGRAAIAALALATATAPGDHVVADDQYVVVLADRDVPPNLVDTSQVRIRAGYLTLRQLQAAVDQPDVRAVLFYSGRFELVPGFHSWVAAHLLLAGTFGGDTALYLKLPPSREPV